MSFGRRPGRGFLGAAGRLAKAGPFDEVDRLLTEHSFDGFNDDAARALAACGARCSDALQAMAIRSEQSRLMVLRALAFRPPPKALNCSVCSQRLYLQMAELSFAERDQLTFLRSRI